MCLKTPIGRFSPGEDFAPQGRVAVSEDIFGCHSWGGDATGTQWVEAGGAVQHPTDHSMAPHGKGLSSPKCPQCQGWEILLQENKATTKDAASLKRIS